MAIAARADNQDIKGFDSLKNKKIAVEIGTTGAEKSKFQKPGLKRLILSSYLGNFSRTQEPIVHSP